MLSWEYPPHVVGGMGRHVAELSPALVKQGVEVHIITPIAEEEKTGHFIEEGVQVHRVLAPQLSADNNQTIYDKALAINQALEAQARQLLELADGVIHTHDWLTCFAGIALHQEQLCNLVATIHATERGRSRGFVVNELQQAIEEAENELVANASQIIVCSHYMSDEVQSFFQAPADKLTIIPNGVDLVDLTENIDHDLAEFRTNYAAPDEQLVFTVARLVYEKGIHLLVSAALHILEAVPNTQIIIAGRGPETTYLQQHIEQLGITNRVHLIGFISDEDKERLFQVADCAVFPSLYEPFGIVALEAMALGCPVIVSDVGGLSEVVQQAQNGLKIQADDEQSLAEGIIHALQNSELMAQYAATARHSVQELYNWPRIADLTRQVYEKATA